MPSFSEAFHSYLDADRGSREELEALGQLFIYERKPGQWVGGMLQELEGYSRRLLEPTLKSKSQAIPNQVREQIEPKWLLLAGVLRNPWPLFNSNVQIDPRLERILEPRSEEARLLLLGLYSFIRRIEDQYSKWWHKGTVCWFIADASVEAQRLDLALTYFLLAMIEDVWSWHRSKAKNKGKAAKDLPAFAGLRAIVSGETDGWLACASNVVSAQKRWSKREPELTYLKTMCRLDTFATPRGTLPFVNAVAKAFLTTAGRARGVNTKGEAYELLLAYLFETTEGFQAVLNAIGRDQENDLLVVNRRSDVPLRCLGEFVICQCKNTQKSAGAALLREFAGRLLEAGCESGVFLCKKGISGVTGDPAFPHDAVSTRMKARQREGMNILTMASDDLKAICSGSVRFDTFMSDEYVRVRFDLLRADETKAGGTKAPSRKRAKRKRGAPSRRKAAKGVEKSV